MHNKKNLKRSNRSDENFSFLSPGGSIKRILLTSPQNTILCEIASIFDDQFHYSISNNNDKIEVFFSPSVEKITGYKPEELIKFDLFGREIIIPEDLPTIKKQLSQLESGKIKSLELLYRINRKDGEIVWLKEQIKSEVISGEQKVIGLIIDVTDFQKKEDQYIRSLNDLKSQITARDNFLSILSHDLRAPFSSILGFTEILLSDAILSDAERTEYLNYINDSSNNQLRLVNYLLDWSNLQTGRLNINKHRVQAQGLVFNCISALTGTAIRKNIDIKVNVPQTIFVEIDEKLITQVITNLVSNAIKFSETHKTVYITADRFNNDFVEFIIKDEGVGIPENFQQRIFRFDKMFSTRGTKGERGTGLGLSLVKEIVERHNGQIWFYSKENVGSEFHFTVPSSENSILVVENKKEDFNLLQNLILENYPEFKFIGTDNGFEAINIVIKRHPSLIISSHDLPLMNGVQFVKSILRGNNKFYAPIIALVDSVDETTIKSYRDMGIKTILHKPIDYQLANKEITQALN